MYHNKRKEVGASKCFDIRFGIGKVYAFGKLVEWDSSTSWKIVIRAFDVDDIEHASTCEESRVYIQTSGVEIDVVALREG